MNHEGRLHAGVQRTERKLAAILAADVVGYSRLVAEDEEGTVHRLRQYRDTVDGVILSHRGRVFGTAGDSVVAEFASAVEAVRCAIEVQRAVAERNSALPEGKRLCFRIGVNLGDVLVEGDDLLGDGVNIAARLESIAEPGGICVSAAVHEQTHAKLEVAFEELGERQLKNIPEPVRVFRVRLDGGGTGAVTPAARPWRPLRVAAAVTAAALIVVAAAAWLTWPAPAGLMLSLAGLGALPVNPPLPDKPSIVVLPFANLSDDPEQGYLADALTEDVTADLATIPWIFVISRSSAYTYEGVPVNVAQVSRELGVRYLLEGSVRKVGNRVRVTAQLIDATRDVHVWSQRYDRELGDLLDLQSEISEQLLGALGVEIYEAESARLHRKPTENLTAYEAFSRGIVELRKITREGIARAQPLFERAIEVDPQFAAAHAALALSNTVLSLVECPVDRTRLPRARRLAERALALDPFEPLAHLAMSNVKLAQERPENAVLAAQRAVELAPGWDIAHNALGSALLASGRFVEAIGPLRQALRLSPRPLAPMIGILANANYATGRHEQAAAFWERAIASNPDVIPGRVMLAGHYVTVGEHEKARALVREVLRKAPECTAEAAAWVYPDPAARPEFAARLRRAGLP
jgi:TolB-like protein/class 3 adenylate cyclase/Tfp pilus assembly protein PilF